MYCTNNKSLNTFISTQKYRKIYFSLYTIRKKNYYEKFNIITCCIVLPEISV